MNTGTLPTFPVYSELQLHVASKYACFNFGTFLYFRWKMTSDNGKIIVERHDIRSLRVKYLRAITAYREEWRPTEYTDETYIYTAHIQHRMRGMMGREQD